VEKGKGGWRWGIFFLGAHYESVGRGGVVVLCGCGGGGGQSCDVTKVKGVWRCGILFIATHYESYGLEVMIVGQGASLDDSVIRICLEKDS